MKVTVKSDFAQKKYPYVAKRITGDDDGTYYIICTEGFVRLNTGKGFAGWSMEGHFHPWNHNGNYNAKESWFVPVNGPLVLENE